MNATINTSASTKRLNKMKKKRKMNISEGKRIVQIIMPEWHDHQQLAKSFIQKPIEHTILEFVLSSNTIIENNSGILSQLLGLGSQALRSRIMPGIPSYTNAVLYIRHGREIGIDEYINTLSSTNTPIIKNPKFWNSIQRAFGLDDNTIANMANKIGQAIPQAVQQQAVQQQTTQPQAVQQQAVQQQAVQQQAVQQQATQPQTTQPATQPQLNAGAIVDYLKNNPEEIDKIRRLLTNESNIKQRREIIDTIIVDNKKEIYEYFCKTYNIPMLSEAGLINRLRTYISNPTYASNQTRERTIQYQNSRIARLVVTIAAKALLRDITSKSKKTQQEIEQAYDRRNNTRLMDLRILCGYRKINNDQDILNIIQRTKGRLSSIEEIILKNRRADLATVYAQRIKGRWKNAEDIIFNSKDPKCVYEYTMHAINTDPNSIADSNYVRNITAMPQQNQKAIRYMLKAIKDDKSTYENLIRSNPSLNGAAIIKLCGLLLGD